MYFRPCNLYKGFCLIGLVCVFRQAIAQQEPNTFHYLTLQQADSLFLHRNFLLLAEHYNLTSAEAQLVQSQLWDNPNVSLAQGAYNPTSGTFFNLSGPNSENAMALQQLFRLAGKRGWQVRMARTNYQMALSNFYDLVRQLNHQLTSTFFDLYFQQLDEQTYRQEIHSLDETVTAFRSGVHSGYISEKEFIRIEALLLKLQSEYTTLENQILRNTADLKILLADSSGKLRPSFSLSDLVRLHPDQFSLGQLLDSAYTNRPDLKIAEQSILLNHENVAYQKALAVPDLTLGASFDKRGSYITDYNALTLSIDLPILNRNQGNIRAAKAQVKFAQEQFQEQALEIRNRIGAAYVQALNNDSLSSSIPIGFQNDFQHLATKMLQGYANRTVTLLDFIDFFDAYKETSLQIHAIMNQKIQALEDLNYDCGSTLYPL